MAWKQRKKIAVSSVRIFSIFSIFSVFSEIQISLQKTTLYSIIVKMFIVHDNLHLQSGHTVYFHVNVYKLMQQHLSLSVALSLLILQHLSALAVCCKNNKSKKLLILQHLSAHAVCCNNKKSKKCQPAARDTSRGGPHTGKTGVGVPGSGLTRPKQKNIRTKKLKNENELTDVTLANRDELTKWYLELKTTHKKTTKCQPAVRDTSQGGPHTSKTGVGVPDSGLTRPNQKNYKKEKIGWQHTPIPPKTRVVNLTTQVSNIVSVQFKYQSKV